MKKAAKEVDRWSHDRFNENEQAPKSRSELVSAYGYDIRTEDCAPRSRRPRRYGRHQLRYDRNWEDEEAYKKSMPKPKTPKRPPRPEDFPALGSSDRPPRASSDRNRGGEQQVRRIVRSSRPQDENDPSSYNRSPVRSYREQRGSRDDRNQREPRRYNNDNSNSNNSRNVKGKKNINFNHNIELKNQNRKNINYESSQAKKNNVLNQQIQSSSSQSGGHSSSSHHQPSTSNGQRFNNDTQVTSMSFTNSKMNNATNSNPPSTSRAILNYDNSSGNYGRGSREKEVNQQQQQQQQQAMSPSKNLQQYSEHQHEQLKMMEKNYQQQGKSTNLTMNQVPMNNMQQEVQMMNNAEITRAKRYSSIHQRSNLNEPPPPQQQQQQQQSSQQAPPTQSQQQPLAYQQYQEMDPTQISPAYIAAQQTPQPTTQSQQQPTQQQKYQINQQAAAAYYTNPPNDFAAAQQASLMNAMVEKYQFQQQPPSVQYISPQQAQQIYQPQQQQQPIYVPTPAAAPTYTQYAGYQNYNMQATPTAAPPPQPQPTPAPSQPIYQTQSGLTYFPNTQIAQTHPQRIIQPQRRPPNPIPILAPPDHKKNQYGDDEKTEGGETTGEIDHILDNMFVQRQPYEPTIPLKDAPAMSSNDGEKGDQDQISDGMNVSNSIFIFFCVLKVNVYFIYSHRR